MEQMGTVLLPKSTTYLDFVPRHRLVKIKLVNLNFLVKNVVINVGRLHLVFLKWAIPGLFFFIFRLFNTVDSKMFNINFADEWI